MAAPKLPHRYLYTYRSLPTGRSFRLLRFRDFLHDELCELETFEIDDCPSFSTLSYTWGAPLNTAKSEEHYKPETSKIFILNTESGQRQLLLSKNLYEGLCQLTKYAKPEYIWVDAICINQEDEAELASQVTMMGAVYSSCEQVIVWLGKDDSNLKDFKWLHEVFLPVLWRYGETNGQESILKATWNVDLIKKRLGIDTGKTWDSYAKFYHERRWFSRAWVMQELTLAPNVIVLAGSSKLDWDDMTTLANIISLNGLGLLLQESQTSSKRKRQPMGFECLRLHAFRALFHQLALKSLESTPASRSSTWDEMSPVEPTTSKTSVPETILSSFTDTHIQKTAIKIARRIRTSSDTVTNAMPKKTSEIARAIRASSSKSISKVPKLLSSSPSPNLGSWGSVKTWSSTMKSKFTFVYGTDPDTNRTDATGFSQWTTALIDNLTANNNKVDRWNTVFLCCCQWVRYFDATKLHDKIYCVLGIIDVLRPADIALPIYPDYSKPIEDLYKSIAWYFIQNLPHLTLLSCVQDRHSRRLATLPSWVPDFSCVSNEDLSFTVKANWNASKAGTKQSYTRKLIGSTLELRGSCLDVIENTVSVFVPQKWTGDGYHLPDGSVMSIHILGHFEKIIRFVCEGKAWPYDRSRLDVLVATLVAGHLTTLPAVDQMLDQEDDSYFPALPPVDGGDTIPPITGKGLGIDLNSPPDLKNFSEVSGRSTQVSTPNQLTPLADEDGQKLPNTSHPPPRSVTLTPGQESLTQHYRSFLKAKESFPYSRGIFQFRCWVLSMLVAGSLSPDTAPHVESVLGAITQLAFLCPSSPGHAHLPTRAEMEAATTAARSLSHKTGFFTEKGLEGATGVGDFVQGQFSEFDVRWSKLLGISKMFRTKRGYLGLGPVGAEAGDQCWILEDARVPYVLKDSKQVEGAYELVGETYLHGCMYGEAMTSEFMDNFGPVSLI